MLWRYPHERSPASLLVVLVHVVRLDLRLDLRCERIGELGGRRDDVEVELDRKREHVVVELLLLHKRQGQRPSGK